MLSACASLPSGPQVVRTPRTVAAFALDGRVAVRQGDTRHYANIAWRHDPGKDEILLTTPLGQGVAEFSRDATGARLVTADRREYLAPDLDGLTAQVFGTALPLDGLPAWLTGRAPDPASGWRIEYLDYQSDAPDALPTLIELRREDIELRLKVDDWSQAQ